MSQINLANMQFAQFVNFANEQPNAAKSETIVTTGADNALAGRTITAKAGDSVGKFSRSAALKDANNEVRALFRASVAEMFGGEDKIPASVRSAMKLGDYGKGKPLTTRRIVAVNTAIEKLKVGAFTFEDAFKTGGFDGEMKKKAEDAGHNASDFQKLNTGANLLAKATGMSLKDALLEVMDKSSAAYACISCGPLYTGSVADFKKGLEIQSKFIDLQSEAAEVAKNAVTSGDAKDYARFAKIRVEQLKIAKKQIENLFAMQTVVGKSNAQYKALMREYNTAIKYFEKAANDAGKGKIEGERELYARIIGTSKLDDVSLAFSEVARAIYKKRNDGDAQQMTAIMTSLNNVNEMCITKARDGGTSAFKRAFAERETSRLEHLMHGAEAKGGFVLPGQFYDSIGINLNMHLFKGADAIVKMAEKLENESSKVLFSTVQKARLEKVVAAYAGKKDAAKLVAKFAAEVETACCQKAFVDSLGNMEWDATRIENLVSHFEKNPGLAKGFVIGFKEDKMKEVKADLKRVMTENFNAAAQRSETEMTSLKTGFMPQSTREYNKGYVTFNGQNLPDGVSGKSFYLADTDYRKGYCEFLESKFDNRHVQMRRLVSFACGMADGLAGAICTGAFTGSMTNNPELVKSPQRNSGYYLAECKGYIQPGRRDDRENYDIRIDAKTGDVTIKLTHYETNLFTYHMTDGGKTISFSKADKTSPRMATTRMEVTMVIKNASDAELGDKMPEFAITEIKQEVA